MSNRNNKNRSIFERRGFYTALYSCIGVVLVLAIGISLTSMNQSGTDMFGRQTPVPEQVTPAPRTQTNEAVMEEVRVEEASIRDILPMLPRINDEPPEEPSPEEPPATQPGPESITPPEPVETTPAPSPDGAGITYTPDALPVMQPLEQSAVIATEDNNQPQQQDNEQSPEVRVIQWDDDPVSVVAHGNIMADPVFYVFSGNNDMGWPVVGDVVMDFSMDSLIHDVTLNQFRTNDKISIQANIGTQVRAASDGVVRSVEHDRRLGNTVVIEHGNGWFTTYSQLQDHVLVGVGDVVIKGQVIGGVGVPSIFYTLLGSHLSFGVTRDDVAVNPMLVLGH